MKKIYRLKRCKLIARKVVHLTKRDYADFLCPTCQVLQDNRNAKCWMCGVFFVFDDEE